MTIRASGFAVAAGALAVLLLVTDLSRPPSAQRTTAIALSTIHAYQRTLSPWMPRVAGVCRFEPTCSRYAEAMIQRHGILRGGWTSFVRIARCGPWTDPGTSDPPR
jgi:putative membrane protein insertion efficiency factor